MFHIYSLILIPDASARQALFSCLSKMAVFLIGLFVE